MRTGSVLRVLCIRFLLLLQRFGGRLLEVQGTHSSRQITVVLLVDAKNTQCLFHNSLLNL